MQTHVPLDQTVRLRYRHTYRIGTARVTLRAQSAIIACNSQAEAQEIKRTLLGQWLPDGIYRGTPTGTHKRIGPDD